MVKQQILLNSAIGLCLGLGMLYTTAPLAHNVLTECDLAQGDGDPNEEPLENAASDELEDTETDEEVATITAEGDFLVPTYLLPTQEELTEKSAETIAANNVSVTKTVTTTTTTTTTTEELPVFDVSGNTPDTVLAKNTENTTDTPVVNVTQTNKVKTSQDTPTPQTPHYIGSGHLAKEITPTPVKPAPLITNKEPSHTPVAPKTPVLSVQNNRPILVPLAPLPKTAEPEPIVETRVRKVIPSAYADQMLTALKQNEQPDFIMPHEIKVSFYKNASEFSGQTIKWIRAFSTGALNDPRLIVQVRLSVQNPAVQQKRLSVVQNTLIGAGLSPHQIQVVFTNRPTDSLILRLMDKPEATSVSVRRSKTGRRVEKRTTTW